MTTHLTAMRPSGFVDDRVFAISLCSAVKGGGVDDGGPFGAQDLGVDASTTPAATGARASGRESRLRILIADDDCRVREALLELIGDDPRLEVVGAVGDADAAIAVAAACRPDVALLDLVMPGGGVWAARQMIELCPRMRVIALSASSDRESVTSMLDAGARRYLVKGADVDVLSAIWQVASATADDDPRPTG